MFSEEPMGGLTPKPPWLRHWHAHRAPHYVTQAIRVKDLPKVPTWRLEVESNRRLSAPNTTTLRIAPVWKRDPSPQGVREAFAPLDFLGLSFYMNIESSSNDSLIVFKILKRTVLNPRQGVGPYSRKGSIL